MELRTLQYFLAVAREQSINKAAESLHMTQPPLSRQMMDLEQELGCTLFIRGNRKITLTEEGMLLRRRAEEMLELAEKTKSEVTAMDEQIHGEVYIGGGETRGFSLVAKACHLLQEQHPDVRFHLYSGNAEDVTDRLERGLLDMALVIGGFDASLYHSLPLPVRDTWGLLLRKDHPLASHTAITASDLTGEPLLISRQALERGELKQWLGNSHSTIAATYNLIYNASLMVEEGLGCAFTLEGLSQNTDSLCFRPLSPPITAGLSMIWKKGQILGKAARNLLDVLQEEYTI